MKKDKIGILLYGKKLNASKREILTAAKIITKGSFEITLFGKSKDKIRVTAAQEGLPYIKLGKKIRRNDFSASLKFTQLLKDRGISTIIFRDHRSTNLLVTSKFLMKGKLRLIFFQDRHLSDMKSDFLNTFRFNQIDAWITPMSQTANTVKAATHLALDKIHVMPLPIPRKPFQFEEEERKLRKSILFKDPYGIVVGWNVPDDMQLVMRTGQRIVDLMRAKKINLCLNVRDSKLETLFALLPELGPFKDSIKSTPFDPHDADMYAHLDALFIDPENEPFSGITRRALMAGVLPFSPKSLVTDELLENGDKGIIYTESDGSEIFVQALDSNNLDSFRIETKGKIGEKYTKKRFRENLEALIHSLPRKAKAR